MIVRTDGSKYMLQLTATFANREGAICALCSTEETVVITLGILVIFSIHMSGVALLYDDVKAGSGFVLAKQLLAPGEHCTDD